MTPEQKVQQTLSALASIRNLNEVRSREIYSMGKAFGLSEPRVKKLIIDRATKVRYGYFSVASLTDGTCAPVQPPVGWDADCRLKTGDEKKSSAVKPSNVATEPQKPNTGRIDLALSSINSTEVHVPAKDPTYVPWGEFQTLKKIVASRKFLPIYISGFSGNGKTMMVTQACAQAKREYVRVQIGPETDEDALLGGFRLIDGETVFNKGPVVEAMERGAVLLIDEIDRGDNKIMCLQSVLEGNPVLIGKTGELVRPQPGFTVIATANTKGSGSDSGAYSAAQIIDEAFLERFVANIEQEAPSVNIETRILTKSLEAHDIDDKPFAENLATWSAVIHKTFANGGIEEIISTRRLCHIVRAFSILGDKLSALKMCISRFDEDTREAFLDLYTKVDSGVIEHDDPLSDH